MKPWRESISLPRPPRDIRLAGHGFVPPELEARLREREHAARERGRAEGEKALSEQLVRQRAELLELQNGVLESLRRAVPQVVRDTESAVIALALEVATKLVGGLPITAEMIEATTREAMSHLEDATEFTIELNPADLELLRQVNSPLMIPQGNPDRIQFRSSSGVSRGGCILHTRFGVIDARRETKIEALKDALLL